MAIPPSSLPYPWSPSGNLCPVLRDGDVWCEAFSTPDMRKQVKRACKGRNYRGHFLNSNEKDFGRAAVWLLDQPGGRAELQRQFKAVTDAELPQFLYVAFYHAQREFQEVFPSKDVCGKSLAGRPLLEPERFGRKIASTPAVREHLRLLAIFACSFAMRQPEKGQAILTALLENCPECEAMVLPIPSVEPVPTEISDAEPEVPLQDDLEQAPEPPAAETLVPPSDEELWTDVELGRCGDALERFQTAYAGMREQVKRLSSEIDNLPVMDDTDKESPAGLLEEMLGNLRATGQQAKAWLDRLDSSLTHGSARDSRDALPLLETLRGHTAGPHDTLDLLRNAGAAAAELLRQISGELALRDERHAHDLAELRRLDNDLGVDGWTMPDPSPAGHLLRALALQPVVAEQVTKRRRELGDQLAGWKHELQQELDLRLENYDQGALAPEVVEQIEAIRVHLARLAAKSDWEALRQKLAVLGRELEEHPQARGVVDLAREALGPVPRNLVPLAQALLVKDRAAEAFTLLTLWQLCEEAEETAVEDFSVLVDTLLTAAVRLDAAGELPFAWTDALFQQPWVRGLRHSDIGSVATARRLAVAMVAQDHLRGTQAEISLFYQLKCDTALSSETYPALSRMLEGIGFRRPLRIVTDLPVSPKQEMAAHIEKYFKLDPHTGRYRDQAAKGADTFFYMERDHLFPKLSEIWSKVRALCGKDDWPAARKAAKLEADDLLHQACQDAGIGDSTSSFYYRQVVPQQTGYIPALGQDLKAYVDACEASVGIPSAERLVTAAALTAELRRLADDDPAGAVFWQAAERALTEGPPAPRAGEISSGEELLAEWCHHSPGAMACCPEMVVVLTRNVGACRPEPEMLRHALARLAGEPVESAFAILQANRCFRHLSLAESGGTLRAATAAEQEETRLLLRDCQETLQRRWDAIVSHPLTSLDAATWEYAMARSCFAFLDEQLTVAEARIAGATHERREADLAWLRIHLKTVTDIKDAAEEREVSRDWLESLLRLCDELERHLRQARTEIRNGSALNFSRDLVESAVQTLRFIVDEGARDFSELEGYLRRLNPVKGETPADSVLLVEQPELMKVWTQLCALDPVETPFPVQRIWSDFAKAFARACDLYHGRDENFQSERLEGYLWPYFKTGFYRPHNTWLHRKIHLCLCFGEKSEATELNRLRDKLSNERDAALNIVFVPSGLERLERLWDYHPGRSGYLLVDQGLLASICARREKPDVPLRQALHRSAENLTGIGLFKSEGYVHRRYDIFVGRIGALEQLAAQPASAIWGGRRTGKTSLMHALKSRLKSTSTLPAPYRVALIYANPDVLDKVDPDITIARQIASELGLSPDFQSMGEFERMLKGACREDCIAVLIDEADAYIINSRRVYGETGFPLARVLRGLTQTDSTRRFKLVYAGFKQLYYEVRMKETSETNYPFKQVLQLVQRNFKDLTADETRALMTTGFVEMLGAALPDDVPRLVHGKTGGHPAFVQRFCERLLTRLSEQRKKSQPLQLDAQDVAVVYNEENWEKNDNASFLYYVHETLGWNVSNLGRALLLALSLDIRANKSPEDRFFTASQILRALEFWYTPELPPPDKRDFDNTLELLTMTNMLTEKSSGFERQYKITYASYIDFMNRLGSGERLEVQPSLAAYHEKEKGKIE